MINLAKYKGSKIGVFGLGRTGLRSVEALSASGAIIYAWDDNKDKVLEATKIIQDRNVTFSKIIDQSDVKNLNFVIISPGVPSNFPQQHRIFFICKKYDIPIKTDIELLFEACPNANYIGVTGTNGKSTTVSLIKHVLLFNKHKSILGGNIGVPVLGLDDVNDTSISYILELSSYQLELLSNVRLNIAVFLNITQDHSDRYKSFEEYKLAKLKIFHNQLENDFAIISLNSNYCKDIYLQLKTHNFYQRFIITSSKEILSCGVSVIDDKIYDNYFTHEVVNLILPQSLLGDHNAENIAATYIVGKILKLSSKKIAQAISTFCGLPHRMEMVLKNDKLTFINDSKATNIAATSKALSSYRNIYWIAGGILKEKDIFELGKYFKHVKHSYLVGRDYHKFVDLLEKFGISYTLSHNIENALIKIRKTVKSGTILLSPACASFDQWKDFEERGNQFKKLVIRYFSEK